MKLILGTAAIGAVYGVNNKETPYSEDSAKEILKSAESFGIKTLDTAPQYGFAQSYIGSFHESESKFEVHSKLPMGLESEPKIAIESIKKSLSEMRIPKLSGLYFHSTEKLFSIERKKVNNLIKIIRESGLVDLVGVSIYDSVELDKILNLFPEITLFQVPENIMDQRLLRSSLIAEAKKLQRYFFVRSVFLQGLLLMKSSVRFTQGAEINSGIRELEEFALRLGIQPIDACLSYVQLLKWADGVVVGVSRADQLAKILNYKHTDLSITSLPTPFTSEVSDPRKWNP
jgi:aryl-alcohol dehydrogenase-like predicted oxidoreductase